MPSSVTREELPFIDELSQEVDAPPDRVWQAVLPVAAGSFRGRAAELLAGLVGCRERRQSGTLGEVGSTVVGFRVAEARNPSLLGLEGEHRFSRYALTFRVDDLGGGRSRLRGETRAEFPGLKGQAYKTLVIRSRGHVLLTRRLLRAVARRAER